jgi:ribosomal protein S18 acetylase RimI-like enzyme
MINFYLALSDDDYANARILYKEYAASINVSLAFQHFDDELNELKKMYAHPYGGIILANDGEEIFACVAVRKISDEVAELKRMYVKPAYQNKGIGKILLNHAIELAKNCNYSFIKLDTLNYMFSAIHLYKKAGFYETPPYYNNPIQSAIYLEKTL